jgi:hypothetical protein
MICIRQKRGEREYLFFGLTEMNLQKLREGKPIRISAETHQGAVPEGWTIGIVWGENKEELQLTLEQAGIIDPR